MASSISRIQIYKHVTRDRVLDISDLLNLESTRSYVCLTLIEFDENFKAVQRVRFHLSAANAKLLCFDILHGQFSEYTEHSGIKLPPLGMVMSPPTGDRERNEEGLISRVMTLRKDFKYRQPYVLKIDNGEGQEIGDAIRMLRATASLTLLMPEWEVRKLAMTTLDYIRDWETVNFRRRQEAQTIILPTDTTAPKEAANAVQP